MSFCVIVESLNLKGMVEGDGELICFKFVMKVLKIV